GVAAGPVPHPALTDPHSQTRRETDVPTDGECVGSDGSGGLPRPRVAGGDRGPGRVPPVGGVRRPRRRRGVAGPGPGAGGNPDFIKGCKICHLTHEALAEYGKLAKAPAAKPGRGLSAETVKKLRSKDRDTRLAALRDLIGGYMASAYAKANLPAAQRARLEAQVKAMAYTPKDPAAGLPGGMPFCPS